VYPIGPDRQGEFRVVRDKQFQVSAGANKAQASANEVRVTVILMSVNDPPTGRKVPGGGDRIGRAVIVRQVEDRRQAGGQMPARGACSGAELAFGAVSVFLRHRHD
jgi:hypothetical protein